MGRPPEECVVTGGGAERIAPVFAATAVVASVFTFSCSSAAASDLSSTSATSFFWTASLPYVEPPVGEVGGLVGYVIGAGAPVWASTTVSDLRKSSTLSAGTWRFRWSSFTSAVRSKYATPLR